MNSSWKEQKLSEFADVIMGQSPKSEYYNYDKIGAPFLQGNRTFGTLYPIYDTWCSNPIKIAKKNSVLMSVRAPVGDMNIAPSDLCIGRGLSSLSMKNSNNQFLFYLLKANQKKILSNESGTVFGSVNKNTIENIKLLITANENEQIRIANILSSLDDKIELNNKINQNLETLAKTLYKHWFVDFEFPNENGEPYKSSGGEMVDSELGLIPKGWEVRELSSIIDFIGGFSFKGNRDNLNKKFKIITIRNVQDGFMDLSTVSSIDKLPDKIKPSQQLELGDILVSLTGNVGRTCIVNSSNCLLNQRVEKIDPYDIKLKGFSYFYFRNEKTFEKMLTLSKGSAQQNLSPVELSRIKIPFFNYESKIFYDLNDFFITILKNQQENQKLAEIRDTLLPKLMNGEIEVPV